MSDEVVPSSLSSTIGMSNPMTPTPNGEHDSNSFSATLLTRPPPIARIRSRVAEAEAATLRPLTREELNKVYGPHSPPPPPWGAAEERSMWW